MTSPVAIAPRPELAERVLAGGARLGEQSMGQLRVLVDERLAGLRRAGTVGGAVVAVEETGPADLVAGVLATWLLGAVPLPCKDVRHTPLTDRAVALAGIQARPPGVPGEIEGLGSTAVLHLTSGSTGEPKVVQRGCASVLNEAAGYRHGLDLTPADRVYVPVPLSHSFGWGIALAALLAGCRLDATPMVHSRRAAVRLRSATVAALTAPLAGLLAATPEGRPSGGPAGGLRVAMVGASRVTTDLDDGFADRFGLRLSRNYGSSETGATFLGGAGLAQAAIGRPMRGVTVLGPGPGTEGELRLRLPPVEGYLGNIGAPATTWHTGDLVRRGTDGIVTFLTRLGGPVRLNDRTVDAEGLDRVLRAASGAEDVVLLTLPRPDSGVEDLYAVLAGTAVDRARVEGCRSSLPDGTQSVRLVYTDRLPVSAVGKLERTRLADFVRREWSNP